jgi:hypothetical protein
MSFLDQGGAKEESCDMPNVEMDEKRSLWNRILGLLEDDLAQRRSAKVFVRVYDQSGFRITPHGAGEGASGGIWQGTA